jgi:hypothetical protein
MSRAQISPQEIAIAEQPSQCVVRHDPSRLEYISVIGNRKGIVHVLLDAPS